jgi:hypothetical protein
MTPEYQREWRAKNIERQREYHRKWRANNKASSVKSRAKWNSVNSRKYYAENADSLKASVIKWRAKNREKMRIYLNDYRRKRTRSNPEYRTLCSLRARIHDVLNGRRKGSPTLKLLGASVQELMVHLEAQFRDGMTWENQGYKGWHIDHIIPCSSFDLTDYKQQKRCFHYTNLQPLWWWQNLSKGKKTAA